MYHTIDIIYYDTGTTYPNLAEAVARIVRGLFTDICIYVRIACDEFDVIDT